MKCFEAPRVTARLIESRLLDQPISRRLRTLLECQSKGRSKRQRSFAAMNRRAALVGYARSWVVGRPLDTPFNGGSGTEAELRWRERPVAWASPIVTDERRRFPPTQLMGVRLADVGITQVTRDFPPLRGRSPHPPELCRRQPLRRLSARRRGRSARHPGRETCGCPRP